MKARVNHIQINVSSREKSSSFYKDLLGYLGFEIYHEDDQILMMMGNGFLIGITETEDAYKKNYFHRKNTGINHLAFFVESRDDIDKFYEEFLKVKNIETLYFSPKEFPEYMEGYYAVFFEDPDRIKLEVLYMPQG